MRILIADDHELVRKGVRSLLLNRSDFEICGEAHDGQDAVEQAQRLNPDLIVMDISMPKVNGLDATREIRRVLPKINILVMSQHDSPEMMRQALKAGASGYVVKTAIASDLLAGIDRVRHGQIFFDESVVGGVSESIDVRELSRRNAEFEKELRESEERFRWAFEQAAVGIAHVATDGRWLRVNRRLCEMLGYSQEELRKLTFQDITHPADLSADLAITRKLVTGEIDRYSTERRYIRKGGSFVWINLTVGAVRDEQRKVKYFMSVVEDISGRKNAEEREKKAAQRQRALFQLADELHRATSTDELYSAAFNAIFSALECDRASILLCDGQGTMHFVSWRGLSEGYRRAVDGHSPWLPGETNPRPVFVSDIDTANPDEFLRDTVKHEGIGALAFIPLVSNGHLIGKFMTYFNGPHEFSQDELGMSLTIARQLAFGIDRKRSEDALRDSEARFRALSANLETLRSKAELERGKLQDLFMRAPAIITLLTGPEHVYASANLEALRMSGRKDLGDLVGKPLREAMPELVSQGYIEVLNEVYRTGVPFAATEKPALLNTVDGQQQKVYLNVIFQPVQNASGQTEGILIHAVDVTAQVVARQMIERSDERRRLAQAAARIGTWEWDAVQNTHSFSSELHRIFGTGENDLNHTEKWYSRVHEEDLARVEQLMMKGHESGRMDFEYRYHHPELGLRWLHCIGRRMRDEARMYGVVLDITARKDSEKALRESEHRARAIVETTPECVKLVASDGTLLHMNPAGLLMVGADSADAILGTNVYELIAPEHREHFREFNEKVCGGEKGSLQFDIIGLKGKRLRMETHAAPLVQPDGKCIQLAVSRDITERSRAEEALRDSEERLRALSEQLDSEVRSRTRQLEQRNSAILRQSEQLRDLSWQVLRVQDEERRHIARELHDSAGQTLAVLAMNLSTLVDAVKDKDLETAASASKSLDLVQQLTREIRTASYLLHPPLLDENGLPSALSWYISGLIERSGLDISLNISEGFGRLPRDMELVIFRLVQECLTNVHRHSGSKSASIQVIRDPERILVEVQDQGKGISPQRLAELQTQGSGVGIRGMRERLRQFGGEMIIESTSAGTTVLVILPVSKDTGTELDSTLESAV